MGTSDADCHATDFWGDVVDARYGLGVDETVLLLIYYLLALSSRLIIRLSPCLGWQRLSIRMFLLL
jgi:hypothetical protein